MVIKARSQTTGGSLAFIENLVPPLEGPPLHRHVRENEAWYVLEGFFRFLADGALLDAPQGSFVFVPRVVAHCFQNTGADEAMILMMFTPAGMERFLRGAR
jgi:uncharacterized cupin superfamily protein